MTLLKPHLRIRRSDEAIWIEDGAGARCCYTYYDRDPGRRALGQRWSYEDAVAITKAAARALTGQLVNDVMDGEPSPIGPPRSTEEIYESADRKSLEWLRQKVTSLKSPDESEG